MAAICSSSSSSRFVRSWPGLLTILVRLPGGRLAISTSTVCNDLAVVAVGGVGGSDGIWSSAIVAVANEQNNLRTTIQTFNLLSIIWRYVGLECLIKCIENNI